MWFFPPGSMLRQLSPSRFGSMDRRVGGSGPGPLRCSRIPRIRRPVGLIRYPTHRFASCLAAFRPNGSGRKIGKNGGLEFVQDRQARVPRKCEPARKAKVPDPPYDPDPGLRHLQQNKTWRIYYGKTRNIFIAPCLTIDLRVPLSTRRCPFDVRWHRQWRLGLCHRPCKQSCNVSFSRT